MNHEKGCCCVDCVYDRKSLAAYSASCLKCGRRFYQTVEQGKFTGVCPQCSCSEEYHEELRDEQWEHCPDCGSDLIDHKAEMRVALAEQDFAEIRKIITNGGTTDDILKFLDTPTA